MFDLTGKIALVSGGAKGIGKGIVIALKNSGAKVIIADIDDATGNKTKNELDVGFMHLDVTQQSACEKVVDDVVKEYGKLDILCSNTGIFPQATIKEMTEADWDKIKPKRHVLFSKSRTSCNGETKTRSSDHYLFHYRCDYWLSGLEPLWCKQSRTIRLYAQCSS